LNDPNLANMAKILIIDDERSIRNTLKEILEFEQYQTDEAPDGAAGLEKLTRNKYDIAICDIKMPQMDGLELLQKASERHIDTQIIMVTGHGDVNTAIEATRLGAFDYIEKPLDLNRLLVSIRNALDKSSLVTETKQLKRKVNKVREIIGNSEAIQRIKDTIARVAPTDARVLITGPNGSGKELVARWIHEYSSRQKEPIVEVNCAAIPSELIESELFGHEKGAFTSAVKQRLGKFELANNGTLFLDEIGDMSLAAQAKVLRALQENKITRVGGDKEIPVNVRVIAATNKDLIAEIERNQFREDLYHRLSVIIISVPPLRERLTDIPAIAESFVEEICREYGYPIKKITAAAFEELQKLSWTGNVRELHNVMERLVIFCDKQIDGWDVLQFAASNHARRDDLRQALIQMNHFSEFMALAEKEFLVIKLEKYQGNVSKTAEAIDMDRAELLSKLEQHGLQSR
jgi:two-component system, NtrC family, nitrogen regulation response regulator NtrX